MTLSHMQAELAETSLCELQGMQRELLDRLQQIESNWSVEELPGLDTRHLQAGLDAVREELFNR